MTAVPEPIHDLVIVCPTWACNFRCWYCYQDHADEWMGEAVVAAVEKFLARSAARGSWLWLEFFGGEPLLCLDVIERLAGAARRECLANGIPFFSGLTTNAHLLDGAVLARLGRVGVNHFQITLDGTPSFHDRQRTLASGRGSWDGVWAGLTAVRRSAARVKVTLRLHYQIDHLDEALRLVADYVNPAFADDDRFAVQFEEIKRLGGPHDARIRPSSPAEGADALRRLGGALKRPGMLLGLNEDSYRCYASRSSSVVITPQGRLAKCTVSMEPIGRLSPSGRAELDDRLRLDWSRRVTSCPDCPKNGAGDDPAPSRLLSLTVIPTE